MNIAKGLFSLLRLKCKTGDPVLSDVKTDARLFTGVNQSRYLKPSFNSYHNAYTIHIDDF